MTIEVRVSFHYLKNSFAPPSNFNLLWPELEGFVFLCGLNLEKHTTFFFK